MNRAVTALAVPVEPEPGRALEYVCSATMFRHQYASAVLPSLAEGLRPIADAVRAIVYTDPADDMP